MAREEDETVNSLMRHLGIAAEEPPDEKVQKTVKRVLHRLGLDPPAPAVDPVLAQAGIKLKAFRERSGWTAPEIAERTGVPLAALEAFEAGERVDEDVLLPALDQVAGACCCSLEELGLDRFELRRPLRREWRRPAPLW